MHNSSSQITVLVTSLMTTFAAAMLIPMDRAFAESEKELRLEKEFQALNDDVKRSTEVSNNCETTVKLSKELLAQAEKHKTSWNYGNAIYDGNMALGLCAIEKDRTSPVAQAEAAKYLEAACNTPGSPQLKGFGLPLKNVNLLIELVALKQTESVLRCLTSTATFWKNEDANVARNIWTDKIKAGRIPAFSYED